VADGTQQSSEYTLPAMYAASFSPNSNGDKYSLILPASITLRISTLQCTVNTPMSVAFQEVTRNTQIGAELAKLSYPLITTCDQPTDRIRANINLQFRALTGHYEGEPTRLTLHQGGGYITGEIDENVTGSGNCSATTGLPFNNTMVTLGEITSAENSKSFQNVVTWRLCSGGSTLPTGAVHASAEMLVTFN